MKHYVVLLLFAGALSTGVCFADQTQSVTEQPQDKIEEQTRYLFCRYCGRPFFDNEGGARRAHEAACPKNPHHKP